MQPSFLSFVLVALGGAVGSAARYGVSLVALRFGLQFPIGTLTANVLGCLIIGFISQIAVKNDVLSPEMRLFLAAGFCGGFTTFSTLMLEITNLIEYHRIITAVLYVGASAIGGLLAVYSGIWIAKLWT
ncbi:MAG: fluoride efflux transporter CrcB [Ignavibacteriae bacterium]|nr:fluoride efflux transporter CrcB [Ignavibacteriota bacterium]